MTTVPLSSARAWTLNFPDSENPGFQKTIHFHPRKNRPKPNPKKIVTIESKKTPTLEELMDEKSTKNLSVESFKLAFKAPQKTAISYFLNPKIAKKANRIVAGFFDHLVKDGQEKDILSMQDVLEKRLKFYQIHKVLFSGWKLNRIMNDLLKRGFYQAATYFLEKAGGKLSEKTQIKMAKIAFSRSSDSFSRSWIRALGCLEKKDSEKVLQTALIAHRKTLLDPDFFKTLSNTCLENELPRCFSELAKHQSTRLMIKYLMVEIVTSNKDLSAYLNSLLRFQKKGVYSLKPGEINELFRLANDDSDKIHNVYNLIRGIHTNYQKSRIGLFHSAYQG